jgi:ABC-type hemin transport system substrate-binding protein
MNPDDFLTQDLPPDARSAVMGLIGSTFAELKKVDESMVSPNNNVRGIKTDIKKLINEANNIVAPTTPQPQIAQQAPQIQQAPQLLPEPVVIQAPAIIEDNDQLLFDFYKKITPEDIHEKLSNINFSLNSVIDKLNKVIKILTNGDKDSK